MSPSSRREKKKKKASLSLCVGPRLEVAPSYVNECVVNK